VTKGEDYVGFKVTGFLVALLPAVIKNEIDPNEMTGRLILALCAGGGALLAIFGDRPKSWTDAGARVFCGIITCFLFGPWLGQRFGLTDTLDGLVFMSGVVGVSSWYVMGTVVRLMIAAQNNGSMGEVLRRLFKAWSTVDVGPMSTGKDPAEKPALPQGGSGTAPPKAG
jgi:hypothetical protein